MLAWRQLSLATISLQSRLYFRKPFLRFSNRGLHQEALGGYLRAEAAPNASRAAVDNA